MGQFSRLFRLLFQLPLSTWTLMVAVVFLLAGLQENSPKTTLNFAPPWSQPSLSHHFKWSKVFKIRKIYPGMDIILDDTDMSQPEYKDKRWKLCSLYQKFPGILWNTKKRNRASSKQASLSNIFDKATRKCFHNTMPQLLDLFRFSFYERRIFNIPVTGSFLRAVNICSELKDLQDVK